MQAVVPQKPLAVRLYRCDKKFILGPLEELEQANETYGLLLLELGEATFGILDGKILEGIETIKSRVPGKHNKGGQSSVRFDRLREIAIDDFFDTVAEKAETIFATDKVKGIILGGGGFTKEDFAKSHILLLVFPSLALLSIL